MSVFASDCSDMVEYIPSCTAPMAHHMILVHRWDLKPDDTLCHIHYSAASYLCKSVKLAIHSVCFTYDAISAGCLPKIRQSANQRELIPIHLAYIMLFSYFWVARENSEFCYYIFSCNSFGFSHENHSMCESNAIHKPRNAIYEKPAKSYRALWYVKMCATR